MEQETVILQFQTPQDFQSFRTRASGKIHSVSIPELTIICACEMEDIAEAINQFGAIIKELPR